MTVQAQMGGGGIAPAHAEAGTGGRSVVITTLRPLYLWEGPGTHSAEGSMGLGVGLEGSGYLAPPGFAGRTVQPIASR